ncbi:MAG: hypothetical protein HY048_15510 [Acidobacteria bacterium]|nr:hypothetical protein [Acidobacteriota bacterium]
METSDVRKQVLRAIEQARRRVADRRARNDAAGTAFDAFLKSTAVPLVRQIANVLKAEGIAFTVFTPSSCVRMMSDRSTEDFIEVSLETDGETPQVVCRTSRNRGSRVVQSERAIGAPEEITESALLEFLMSALEPYVER